MCWLYCTAASAVGESPMSAINLRQKWRSSSSMAATAFGLKVGRMSLRWPWWSGGSLVIGGAGERGASGRATFTQIDEKLSVSFAIWRTASMVTGMKARPYRSVVATGHCSRTSFQMSIAFSPQPSSSQSQSVSQLRTGPESTRSAPYAMCFPPDRADGQTVPAQVPGPPPATDVRSACGDEPRGTHLRG
jgi:hypothetical protein